MTDGQAVAPCVLVRLLRMLANSRELTLFVLIVILSATMSIIYPNNFPTSSNMAAVLLNAAQNGILVTGMMLLMIAGAFDLSIGSILALAGVWAGLAVARLGFPPSVGILVGLSIGSVAGFINGFIVTRIKINPLIATLATMSIFRGFTYVTGGTGINPITDDFKAYGQSVFFGLQTPFWVMIIVVIIAAWLVSKTRFFRQYYFIGGNAKADLLRIEVGMVHEGSGFAITAAKIRVDGELKCNATITFIQHPFPNTDLRGHMEAMAKRIGFPLQAIVHE